MNNDKFKGRKFLATVGFGLVFTGLLMGGYMSDEAYVSLMQFVLPAFFFAQAYHDVSDSRAKARVTMKNLRKRTPKPPGADY